MPTAFDTTPAGASPAIKHLLSIPQLVLGLFNSHFTAVKSLNLWLVQADGPKGFQIRQWMGATSATNQEVQCPSKQLCVMQQRTYPSKQLCVMQQRTTQNQGNSMLHAVLTSQ